MESRLRNNIKLVIVRRVHVNDDGALGDDFVTVAELRYGRFDKRVKRNHYKLFRESAPMPEADAKKLIGMTRKLNRQAVGVLDGAMQYKQ